MHAAQGYYGWGKERVPRFTTQIQSNSRMNKQCRPKDVALKPVFEQICQ